jgi:hypothetical protein
MRRLLRAVVCTAGLAAGAVWAKPLPTYEPPPEQPEPAERRSRYAGFNEEQAEPERPIPWLAIGLGVLAIAITLPLGMKMLRQTQAELPEEEDGAHRPRGRSVYEPEAPDAPTRLKASRRGEPS